MPWVGVSCEPSSPIDLTVDTEGLSLAAALGMDEAELCRPPPKRARTGCALHPFGAQRVFHSRHFQAGNGVAEKQATSVVVLEDVEEERVGVETLGAVLRAPGESHIFDMPGQAFKEHLESQGFAALRGILPDVDAGQSKYLDLFWSSMQQVLPTIDPSRRDTWHLPDGFRGIVQTYGLPQADFAWMVRLSPKVRAAFACIFGTTDLCVSLDAVIIQDGLPKSKGGLKPWLHKDQCIARSTALSVQGVYTYYESSASDGGTCLVPRSHLVNYPWESDSRIHHIRVPPKTGLEAQVQKPNLPPNTMLFFNSRLVHANQAATAMRSNEASSGMPRLGRLGVCVAMAPSARRSQATLKRKETAYLRGQCSTHWPCDNFSLKAPPRWQTPLKGGQQLPFPPADPDRLALL